jgi:hypothetical protein
VDSRAVLDDKAKLTRLFSELSLVPWYALHLSHSHWNLRSVIFSAFKYSSIMQQLHPFVTLNSLSMRSPVSIATRLGAGR